MSGARIFGWALLFAAPAITVCVVATALWPSHGDIFSGISALSGVLFGGLGMSYGISRSRW